MTTEEQIEEYTRKIEELKEIQQKEIKEQINTLIDKGLNIYYPIDDDMDIFNNSDIEIDEVIKRGYIKLSEYLYVQEDIHPLKKQLIEEIKKEAFSVEYIITEGNYRQYIIDACNENITNLLTAMYEQEV